MTKKITLITGGTGGHVFPALSLCEELLKRNVTVDIVIDQRGRKLIHEQMDNIIEIPIHRIVKPFGQLLYPISLFLACLRCLFHFFMHRPKAVVGFGGYTTLPGIIAARILGIPIILHEGNSLLGKANRFLQPWAKAIALSFAQTKGIKHNKVVVTGFPLRSHISPTNNEIPHDKLHLLVIGGSQGTTLFSRLVPDAINDLSKEDQQKIIVHQQCRPDCQIVTKEEYSTLACEIILEPFFYNMAKEYAWAHLVISRSGASTLFELAAYKKPSILIPYASSLEGDQARNANLMNDAAWVFQERDLGPRHLSQILKEILDTPPLLKQKSEAIAKFGVLDAATKLANLVENIIT